MVKKLAAAIEYGQGKKLIMGVDLGIDMGDKTMISLLKDPDHALMVLDEDEARAVYLLLKEFFEGDSKMKILDKRMKEAR